LKIALRAGGVNLLGAPATSEDDLGLTLQDLVFG